MLKETRWEYAAMISGNTDTEHFAALYFTMLGDIKESYSAKHMARTLAKAIKKVQDIQIRVLGCEVANEMNFCISRSSVLLTPCSILIQTLEANGEVLVAIRWKNNPQQLAESELKPLSLYMSYSAAASLRRRSKSLKTTPAPKCPADQLLERIKPASANLTQPHRFINPFGIHVIVASEPASTC